MNTKQLYTAPQRNFLLLGAVLVIVGSFLPWETEGDFVSTWRYGVEILPVFVDNGGLLVSLLGTFIIGLVFRAKDFVKYPAKWVFTSAIVLFIVSAYHIIDGLVRHTASNGVIGAPAIKVGLIVVGIGSMLVLATAIGTNSKEPANYVQKEERP